MPRVVKAALANVGKSKDAMPFGRVCLLANRAAVLAGKDEPVILPAASSPQTFRRLTG
jgi:hypothetical protein